MSDRSLDAVLDALVDSYQKPGAINNLETWALPNRRAVVEAFVHVQHLLFLGFFTTRSLGPDSLRLALGEHLLAARDLLCAQIQRAAAWEDRARPRDERREEGWVRDTVLRLLEQLPALRETLRGDVEAAWRSDPAAESLEDVVFSYPGIVAITAHRVAHRLFVAGVPMIPRILSEHAHARTGIDIHPGAAIGERFFVDHGTGVVVGATTVIGDDVRLYQGVTLGAHSVRGDVERERGRVAKRHPRGPRDRLRGLDHPRRRHGRRRRLRHRRERLAHALRAARLPRVLPTPGSDPMSLRASVVDAIGDTPLIRLRGPSEATGCEILGKAEWLNPGMSVKDRAGKFMILDAEKRGLLKPGGTLVEGTAGNTGIGLAMVGKARGYRVVIVIPNNQSREKKDILRLFGAELVEVPPCPFTNPNNYVHVAQRLAAELGAFYANQWDNLANRQAHIEGTGPEIWRQTGGRVDAFVSAIGTGGTLSGTGIYLKERRKEVVVALADPHGAKMHAWFTRGELAVDVEGDSVTQGIGQGRVTGNVDGAPVDRSYRIPDAEAVAVLDELAANEGLVLGGSSGINVAGAIRLAKDMGPGHTLVTVLCDHGSRYQSQLWDPAFRASKGFPVPPWLDRPSTIRPPLV